MCIGDRSSMIHSSDCAVYNEPAYPNGPCDCGAYYLPTGVDCKYRRTCCDAFTNKCKVCRNNKLRSRFEPVDNEPPCWDGSWIFGYGG